MGLFNLSGLGSGLDVNAIVKAMVNAERAPTELRLNRLEAKTTASLSGVGALKSALSEITAALKKLDTTAELIKTKPTLSDSAYLTVNVNDDETRGTYDIEVLSLAKGSKLVSSAFAGGSSTTFGAGTLNFTAGVKSFSLDIEAGDDLVDIRNKINSESSNFGVTASLVNSGSGTILSLTSNVTGAGNDLVMTSEAQGSVLTSNDIAGGSTTTYDDGTLTFTAGANNFSVAVSASDTLDDIVDLINNDSNNFGVTASLSGSGANTKIVYTSAITGSGNNLVVTNDQHGSISESAIIAGGSTQTYDNGTMTFTAGANTFDVNVSATDTLSDIVDAINNNVNNFGVTAEIYTDSGNTYLRYTSTIQGTGNDLVVTNDNTNLDDISANMTVTTAASSTAFDELSTSMNVTSSATSSNIDTLISALSVNTAATDASISIDGGTSITSNSNTFVNAIQGATLTVIKANDSGETSNVTIGEDSSAVSSALTGLVAALNKYFDASRALTSVNEQSPGIMAGDNSVAQIDRRIRSLLAEEVSASGGSYQSVSAIGIIALRVGANAAQGTPSFALKSELLTDALAEKAKDVVNLLAGENGFAAKLGKYLEGISGTNGSLDQRSDGLQTTLDTITDQRRALNLRLQSYQISLMDKFNSMDTVVARLRSTSSFIEQNLANMQVKKK